MQAANFLVKAIENPWGRKLYAKTLLKNIGQAVYKVSVGKCGMYVGGGRLVRTCATPMKIGQACTGVAWC